MTLDPVPGARHSSPAYPPRRRWLRGALRGLVTGALASTALGLSACAGEPGGEGIRLGGDPVEPTLSCGDEGRSWVTPSHVPGTIYGSLCGEEVAWGAFEIAEPGLVTVTLVSGAELARVAIHRPDGEVAAQIGPERDSVVLEASPGTWEIAAAPVDTEAHGTELITVSIEPGEG